MASCLRCCALWWQLIHQEQKMPTISTMTRSELSSVVLELTEMATCLRTLLARQDLVRGDELPPELSTVMRLTALLLKSTSEELWSVLSSIQPDLIPPFAPLLRPEEKR